MALLFYPAKQFTEDGCINCGKGGTLYKDSDGEKFCSRVCIEDWHGIPVRQQMVVPSMVRSNHAIYGTIGKVAETKKLGA